MSKYKYPISFLLTVIAIFVFVSIAGVLFPVLRIWIKTGISPSVIYALVFIAYGSTILATGRTPFYYLSILCAKIEAHQRTGAKVVGFAMKEYRRLYPEQETNTKMDIAAPSLKEI